VSSLLNEGLVDEIRLTVHPLVVGRGKALFKDGSDRHALELVESRPLVRPGQPDLPHGRWLSATRYRNPRICGGFGQ
jgi:dihydrofolate reductase